MALVRLTKHEDSLHKIQEFLEVPLSYRLSITAKPFRNACRKDDKLVAGVLVSTRNSAFQLWRLHLPCLSSLEVSSQELALAVVLLRTVRLSFLKIRSGNCQIAAVWKGLFSAIEESFSLHTFSIVNVDLPSSFPGLFVPWLQNNIRVRTLSIVGSINTLAAIDLAARIFDAIANQPTVTMLDMSRNQITSSCAANIGNMLRTNTVLKTLVLANNSLRSNGAEKIFGSLTGNFSLETLSLFSNALNLDAQGNISSTELGNALARALVVNRSIKSIDLRNIGGFNHSLSQLCTVLAKRPQLLDLRI